MPAAGGLGSGTQAVHNESTSYDEGTFCCRMS
jgi:hypothetical protein